MKKNIGFLLVALLSITTSFAQLSKPTTWSFDTNKKQVKVGDEVELKFNATIAKDWHLYSSDFDPELGPIVTTITFTPNATYQLVGKLKPIGAIKKYDELWGGNVTYFENKGQFIQKVKILAANPVIEGKINFQSCTDIDGKCVNGKESFKFDKIEVLAAATEPAKTDTPKVGAAETPETKTTTEQAQVANIDTVSKKNASEQAAVLTTQNDNTPKPQKEAPTSLWSFLGLAFLAGVASIFMPCIYPIMPMTVSFFTKQSNGTQKAVFYGLSIMLIFALIGFVTMAFGAPFLNFISTHWIPNLVFFIIFILFGVSLLGAFEIVMPSETVTKIDRMSEKGGLLGIFFMALTLVVVSFSCTVPFVGSLLILAAQGEVWRPLWGMLAFGLPFALVFSLLAMFPQWLKNLPKSGGWLGEMKVVFGLLEFALALKFLSNIDLAYHWNLLHRNIFLVLWIVIFVVIGLYIIGFMRLPSDSKVTKYAPSRIAFAIFFFAFAIYMIPGVTGKSLDLLSGILPPKSEVASAETPLANDKMRTLPHGLQGFADYDDALAYAKEVNKPVLLDFTGYACANCRKMEENVWPNTEVLAKLKNDFVIASLYVDDKKELAKEKQYTSTNDKELKTTIGDKNMDLEITKFNNNAQPYYCVVDADGNSVLKPIGYTDATTFSNFLSEAKKIYDK